ncbi:MAG: hypothetical protein A3I14_14505 [Candidatus Rokubacteria bacterium RIFCSPLOWO2_02_FULL_73_56]|nr:MAG: hypothetical protein A3I14_14505 [Candidatus Rokubacteria bacterium RIFCSPLOWO2_02_FULL_73_56]OGL25030.1 MAG: hypothetical protein A3G44_01075 [Candidatus Rokubacteria bacterium RIFCSPLOWO2_12_FULL_73_47]
MRAALAAAALLLAAASPAAAESPSADMQQYTEHVLRLIQDASVREKDTLAALQAAVRKVAIRVFGAAEAARQVLGRHWEARTPAEREDFVQLFADLLEATYIARMDGQHGFKIRYVGELIEGDRAEVRARVFNRKGQEMIVDARLVHQGGRWLVWDVAVEGVSLVQNYRAQFDRVVRRSSYAELVRLVRAKRDELLSGKRARAE